MHPRRVHARQRGVALFGSSMCRWCSFSFYCWLTATTRKMLPPSSPLGRPPTGGAAVKVIARCVGRKEGISTSAPRCRRRRLGAAKETTAAAGNGCAAASREISLDSSSSQVVQRSSFTGADEEASLQPSAEAEAAEALVPLPLPRCYCMSGRSIDILARIFASGAPVFFARLS